MYGRSVIGIFSYACGIHVVGNEMKWSTFYVPPCIQVSLVLDSILQSMRPLNNVIKCEQCCMSKFTDVFLKFTQVSFHLKAVTYDTASQLMLMKRESASQRQVKLWDIQTDRQTDISADKSKSETSWSVNGMHIRKLSEDLRRDVEAILKFLEDLLYVWSWYIWWTPHTCLRQPIYLDHAFSCSYKSLSLSTLKRYIKTCCFYKHILHGMFSYKTPLVNAHQQSCYKTVDQYTTESADQTSLMFCAQKDEY